MVHWEQDKESSAMQGSSFKFKAANQAAMFFKKNGVTISQYNNIDFYSTFVLYLQPMKVAKG